MMCSVNNLPINPQSKEKAMANCCYFQLSSKLVMLLYLYCIVRRYPNLLQPYSPAIQKKIGTESVRNISTF